MRDVVHHSSAVVALARRVCAHRSCCRRSCSLGVSGWLATAAEIPKAAVKGRSTEIGVKAASPRQMRPPS